ncbi:MAG: MFS transporter [Candidatus Bathyarchaeota archaeon]|nr:MAG: MFS transporter [Candidatus Bathyarchaeota archaeon]
MATGIMCSWGWGVWHYSFGLYFEPLQEEFGWYRAEISAAGSLRTLEGGLEGPFGGYLTDKYGPRVVNLLGILISGLGFITMYFVNSLLGFLLTWGFVISLGFNLGMWGPLGTAIAKWFVKKRGLASSIARVITAIGDSMLPTFVLILMTTFGWRSAALITGLITWAIGIPLTWFFIKPRRPEFYGMMPDGVKVDAKMAKDTDALIKAGQEYTAREMGEVEFTVRQALKTRVFWLSVFGFWSDRIASPLFTMHLIPHLTDIGIDRVAATTVLGFMVLVSAPARLLGGILADRISLNRLKYIRILNNALVWLGLLCLMSARDLWMVYAYAIFRGFGLGINAGAGTQIVGRYWGRKGYATITGIRAMLGIPVGVFAPIYVGWLYDNTGSYMTAFEQALILYVASIIIWYFYNPPKRVAAVSDVKKFL